MARIIVLILLLAGCQSTTLTDVDDYKEPGLMSWEQCVSAKDLPQGKAEFERKLPTMIQEAQMPWLKAYVSQMPPSQLKSLLSWQIAVQQADQVKARQLLNNVAVDQLDQSWVHAYQRSLIQYWRLRQLPLREIDVRRQMGADEWVIVKELQAYPYNVLAQYDGQDRTGLISRALWAQDSWGKMLPALNSKSQTADVRSPHHYGLVLPMSGEDAQMGQAIKNGFMAAFYVFGSQDCQISFYDSGERSMTDIVSEGEKAGVTDWIGPIAAQSAVDLANKKSSQGHQLSFQQMQIAGVVSLSLSSHHEARAAARDARKNGYTNALLLTSDSSWHKALAAAFTDSFESLGGRIVVEADVAHDSKKNISQALGVPTAKIAEQSGLSGALVPMNSQDVDVVFMALNSEEAAMARPMLKYLYAGHLPVYATSAVISSNRVQGSDLGGVRLFDWPWLHKHLGVPQGKLAEIRQQLIRQYADFHELSRFYGMGVDAFLVSHFQPSDMPVPLFGATGALTVKDDVIERSLIPLVIGPNGLRQAS